MVRESEVRHFERLKDSFSLGHLEYLTLYDDVYDYDDFDSTKIKRSA